MARINETQTIITVSEEDKNFLEYLQAIYFSKSDLIGATETVYLANLGVGTVELNGYLSRFLGNVQIDGNLNVTGTITTDKIDVLTELLIPVEE